jgi:membrane-associated protein
MQLIGSIFQIILHLDTYLRVIAIDYGPWVYLILFMVIFCETGLVVTPFLPGDSVLFMLGTLAASGVFSLIPSIAILSGAAIIGDTVNYSIGTFTGPKAFTRTEGGFFKKDNLVKAEAFYEKWGGSAIILGRFMPIIRTFVPFAAGIGRMRYGRFIAYNVVGGILWVLFFTLCGYFFGNVPFVQANLTPIMYAIVLVSVIPAIVGGISTRRRTDRA